MREAKKPTNQKEAKHGPISGSNEKIICSNSNDIMNGNQLIRRLLYGLTDSELKNLVQVREEARRTIPAPRRKQKEARRPIPTPRRNVRQLIQYFENNPILPDRPIPAPRTKQQQPVADPRTKIIVKRKDYTGLYRII